MATCRRIHHKEVRFIPTEFGRLSIHLKLKNAPYRDPCVHYSRYYNCLLLWHVPVKHTISVVSHTRHNRIVSIIIHGTDIDSISPQLSNLLTSREDRFGWEFKSEIGSICGVQWRQRLSPHRLHGETKTGSEVSYAQQTPSQSFSHKQVLNRLVCR